MMLSQRSNILGTKCKPKQSRFKHRSAGINLFDPSASVVSFEKERGHESINEGEPVIESHLSREKLSILLILGQC